MFKSSSRQSMAADAMRKQCLFCEKVKATSKCTGCLRDFCYSHLIQHRQELSRQLDHIELNRDLFKDTLNKHAVFSNNDYFIKQINQWEQDSIKLIQQTANDCRQTVMNYRNQYHEQVESNLKKFTEQIRDIRKKNDFNEINLIQLKQDLKQVQQQLQQPLNLEIQEHYIPLVNKISIALATAKLLPSTIIQNNTKWKLNGSTVAGGNGPGNELSQLCCPQGIYVDDDQTIYIADYDNHRIVEWIYGANYGRIVAGGNGQGNQLDQLNSPTAVIIDRNNDSLIISDAGNRRVMRWSHRNGIHQEILIAEIDCIGLTMDNNGDLYVSSCLKNEVRRWKHGDTTGTIVAGGNGKGGELNQLSCSTYIYVDDEYSVYVSDCNNNRVMKWMKDAKEGIVVAGGYGQGVSLSQLSLPQGIIVDHLGNVYVADSLNHRIVRWLKGSHEGTIVVAGNDEGHEMNQFDCSVNLSFDRQGNLYVVDYNNHRVQKFDIDAD